jgi:hypothetical protein
MDFQSLPNETWQSKKKLRRVATSQASLSRRIGRVDGLDWPRNGYFAVKPFHLPKIVSSVHKILGRDP